MIHEAFSVHEPGKFGSTIGVSRTTVKSRIRDLVTDPNLPRAFLGRPYCQLLRCSYLRRKVLQPPAIALYRASLAHVLGNRE